MQTNNSLIPVSNLSKVSSAENAKIILSGIEEGLLLILCHKKKKKERKKKKKKRRKVRRKKIRLK